MCLFTVNFLNRDTLEHRWTIVLKLLLQTFLGTKLISQDKQQDWYLITGILNGGAMLSIRTDFWIQNSRLLQTFFQNNNLVFHNQGHQIGDQ